MFAGKDRGNLDIDFQRRRRVGGEVRSGMITSEASFLPRLLNVVRDAQHHPGSHCAFTRGDFCYRWQTEATHPEPVRFWSDGVGVDLGFAWLNGDHLHLVSRTREPWLLSDMLAWGEEVARDFYDEPRLIVPADDADAALQRLLGSKGYERVDPTLIQWSLGLQNVSGLPEPPAGYSIGSTSGPERLEGWATAYRQAFAPENMTAAMRQLVNRSPLFREELDLVACDSDGSVVAFALAWFDEATQAGTFEPLGCAPDHQRRGLTRMLMAEGLSRLQEMGAHRAFVTTTENRLPANRLYESLGFRTEKTVRTWRAPA